MGPLILRLQHKNDEDEMEARYTFRKTDRLSLYDVFYKFNSKST